MPSTLHFQCFRKYPASDNPLAVHMPDHSLVANPGHQGFRIGAAISLLESPEVGILVRQVILNVILDDLGMKAG